MLPKLTITSAIYILIVAILIYQFILIIRGRRAVYVLLGICILGITYVVAIYARLELLRTLLATRRLYHAIALIVMFQSELRRMLARLGRRPFLGISQLERRELTQEVLFAVNKLALGKTGALIVLERKIGLRTFVRKWRQSGRGHIARFAVRYFSAWRRAARRSRNHSRRPDRGGRLFPALDHESSARPNSGRAIEPRSGLPRNPTASPWSSPRRPAGSSVAAFGEIELNVPIERIEQLLTERPERGDMRPPGL